jgi:hypothetical protein
MRFNWREIKPRNILTVIAEITTILSLALAWVMYQDSKNPSLTTPAQGLSPVILVFVVANIAMFLFLSFTIVKTLVIHVNGKQYQLSRKLDAFLNKSASKYLNDKKRDNANSYASLIERTKKALKNMDENKAFDNDIYYMLLYSLFFDATGDIYVVSILDDKEWVDTPEENEFLRVNLALAEKRIHLHRIFVVDDLNAAKEKLNNKSIQSFLEADHTYIHLFVVYRNNLSRAVINDIGSGFIEFYNFMVACDIFSDKEIRGTLKTDSTEVKHYHKIYMQLNEFFEPLNQEFWHKYFPAPIGQGQQREGGSW